MSTDEQGVVESVQSAPANRSEMRGFTEVIAKAGISKGKRVLSAPLSDSRRNREYLKSKQLKDGIMRRKMKGKEWGRWSKLRNKLIARRRFVVERTFGTLKRVYGLHRARSIGLEKVHGEAVLKAIAYNLKRGLKHQEILLNFRL